MGGPAFTELDSRTASRAKLMHTYAKRRELAMYQWGVFESVTTEHRGRYYWRETSFVSRGGLDTDRVVMQRMDYIPHTVSIQQCKTQDRSEIRPSRFRDFVYICRSIFASFDGRITLKNVHMWNSNSNIRLWNVYWTRVSVQILENRTQVIQFKRGFHRQRAIRQCSSIFIRAVLLSVPLSVCTRPLQRRRYRKWALQVSGK